MRSKGRTNGYTKNAWNGESRFGHIQYLIDNHGIFNHVFTFEGKSRTFREPAAPTTLARFRPLLTYAKYGYRASIGRQFHPVP